MFVVVLSTLVYLFLLVLSPGVAVEEPPTERVSTESFWKTRTRCLVMVLALEGLPWL
jgi:hypothetical protein